MRYALKPLSLVLLCMSGAYLSLATGCDDRAAKLAEAKYYKQQEKYLQEYSEQQVKNLERQNAEWEAQVERTEAQDRRYDAILLKWEKQAATVDALLTRWDRILGVLEEHSLDR